MSYKVNISIGRTEKGSLGAYRSKVRYPFKSPLTLLACQTTLTNLLDIAIAGRFLRPISADDVLFGNTFDRPLKLPWGSGAALKFMQ